MENRRSTRMTADICLILEGTYPYVSGGVSSWTHELIARQSHLKFHIVCILPRDQKDPEPMYTMASNVVGVTNIHLHRLQEGNTIAQNKATRLFSELEQPLLNITTGTADLSDLKRMMDAFAPFRDTLGQDMLLDSEAAWELVTHMYQTSFADSSMLDYFWSWRAIVGGLYSLLTAPLPKAKAYHVMSTGFAGLYGARAYLETSRPVILTEHGIYTNERRIEISSADWLEENASKAMTVDPTALHLRDLWNTTFVNYSRICYESCRYIITLFSGNQQAQIADGADPEKMQIIPNGVDIERYGNIVRKPHARPTVALIGRVVPIKDVKNYLRAVQLLVRSLPDLRAFILGPTDEDPLYAKECRDMVDYFGLTHVVEFTGRVIIDDYLSEIDVLMFSSISEAQPLTILEAGACGIPVVATDVGACAELLLGKADESPPLGAGGVVVPLANTQALAEGALKLLTNREFHDQCGAALKQRVAIYYNKKDQHEAYRSVYASCINQEEENYGRHRIHA
jgi:glycosyltransferase involved in cell wall biosynthesis